MILCPACVAKNIKIVALKIRIRLLITEIHRLRGIIRRLKKIIRATAKKCKELASESEQRMAQGGLPRAAFAYIKAVNRTAEALLTILHRAENCF